jgi:hypothetical protein
MRIIGLLSVGILAPINEDPARPHALVILETTRLRMLAFQEFREGTREGLGNVVAWYRVEAEVASLIACGWRISLTEHRGCSSPTSISRRDAAARDALQTSLTALATVGQLRASVSLVRVSHEPSRTPHSPGTEGAWLRT